MMAKKTTACIAVLLLVSLLMGMVPVNCIDLAAARLAALAEEQAAQEAAQPVSERMTSDDGWIYRLCADGYAEVLGYADSSATNLSIPYSLGGAWVVRIGEDAFADNAALTSIFIPGTIAEIADTAFSVQSGLTVRAYNGAGALAFAKAKGFAQENLSEYDFFDEIIDLTELKSAQWSFQGSAALTIADPWARRIEVGTRMYIPPCRKYESGMPVQATSVTASGTSVTAVYTSLDFMDAVETYHAEDVPLYLDVANAVILADGVTIDDPVQSYTVETTGELSSVTKFNFLEVKTKSGKKINGSFTLNNTMSATIDYGFFKVNEIVVKKTTGYIFDINLQLGSTVIDNKYDLMQINSAGDLKEVLEFAKVPFLQAGAISGYVSLGVEISGEGKLSLTCSWGTSETTTYKSDGTINVTKSKTTNDVKLAAAAKAAIMLKGSINIALGFGGQGLDIVSLSLSMGPQIAASATATLYKNQEDSDSITTQVGTTCITFEIDLLLNLDVKMGLLDAGFYASKSIFNIELALAKLYWDFEGMKWIDDITKYSTTNTGSSTGSVRVRFYTGTDIHLKEQYVPVGSTVEAPVGFPRAGYTLLGWSCWQNSNELWDFENDTVSSNLTLYAVWQKNSTSDTETAPTPTPTIAPTADSTATPTVTPTVDPTPTPYVMSPEEEASMEYLWFSTYSNYVEIWDCSSSATEIVIPQYINSVPVTSISFEAFEDCQNLTSIVIPDSVTYIGSSAFKNCNKLTSIHIPDGVSNIYSYTFWNCYNLTDITLPDSITSIDKYAFALCTNLTNINIPDTITFIGEGAFDNCESLTHFTIPSCMTSISPYVFYGANIATISIPDNITDIGDRAFGYSEIVSISIPDTVTSMGEGVFEGCENMINVTIPDSISEIPEQSFENCISLSNIFIPDSVTTIGSYSFSGCEKLSSITIPANVKSIDFFAFDYDISDLLLFTQPNSVAASYFSTGSRNATILYLTDTSRLLSFDTNGGTAVQSRYVETGALIEKPEEPTRDQYTFTGWYSDEACTVKWNFYANTMPDVPMTLYAGWDYTPSGFVYDIAGGCATVTGYVGSEIYLEVPAELGGATVTALAAECIGEGVRRITLPATVETVDPEAFRWAFDLHTITVDEDNPHLYSMDSVLYAADGTLVCYPRAKKSDAFTPADGATAIGDYAFYAADGLNALTLPEGIASIGSRAIYDCDSIESLTIPASVTSLGDYAIYSCGALARVDFESDPVSIGAGCFVGCADDLEMFGPVGAEGLNGYADTYLLSYNEYLITYMMYGEVLAYVSARAGDLLGEPPGPEDGEMSFKGWSLAEDGELWNFDADVMPAEDITLYAIWKYDFSYESVDGGVKLLKYTGDKTEIRVPAAVDGYTVMEIASDCFDGLTGITLIADKGSVAESFASANGFAFEALTYTLTFRSNGGTYIAPRTLCATDAIEEPTVSRTNYTFLGWYSDADCTEAFDFTTGMPAADLTLYAGWEKIDSTVDDVPFDFTSNDTGLTITGYTGTKTTATIPEEINGVAVTAIGAHAFDGDQTMFTVTVPGSVTEIGEAAFASSRVSEVILESGVTTIGAYAFDSCYELQSISVADTVTSIGEYAFQDCVSLLEIALPDGLTAISDGMLAGCSFLEALALPAALETIGDAAFESCISLASIELGANVCDVLPGAFNGCSDLSEITVSGSNMYYKSLDGVLLSADGSTLVCYPQGKGDDAYAIPSGVTTLGDGSMAGSGIETLTLNAGLTYIGEEALRGSRYLSELVIPADSALNGIGESAFQSCIGLTVLNLPASLNIIEANAFDGCTLKSVTFGGDTLLASDAIPACDGLTFYGSHGWDAESYAEVYGIRYIDLSADVPVTGIDIDAALTIEKGASTQLTAVFTPENTTETAVEWSSSNASIAAVDENGVVSGRYVGTAVITATALNGSTAQCTVTVIASQPKQLTLSATEAVLELGGSLVLTATLPEGIESAVTWGTSNPQIATVDGGTVNALCTGTVSIVAAADGCETATCQITVTAPERLSVDLTLPQALTQIEAEAFAGDSFVTVALPEGVISIGARAFADCFNLQQIVIPASVETIAEDAFDGCDGLVIFCSTGSKAEEYALSHGILCAAE